MSTRKNNLFPYQTITSGDMSTASLTSLVTAISFLDDLGIQLNFSGSPVGNFQVQVSADHAQDASSPPNTTVAGNWIPLVVTYWTGAAFATGTDIPTSLGSPIYLDLALLSAPWIRVVYTKTSGTGTLNAYITGKQL